MCFLPHLYKSLLVLFTQKCILDIYNTMLVKLTIFGVKNIFLSFIYNLPASLDTTSALLVMFLRAWACNVCMFPSLLDKTACCPWGGAGGGAVLQGNISAPAARCCVLGRAAVHCTLLGWRGGGATAAWSQWPGPAAPHTDTTITTHQHTLTTGAMWQYQPGDTAAMLTNVGHHTALTGLRWLAAVVGNTYTLHSAF